MNIGIYLGWGTLEPEAGGGHTFQQSLLQVLAQVPTEHQFYVFYYGTKPNWRWDVDHITLVPIIDEDKRNRFYRGMCKPLTWWQQKKVIQRYKTYLNKAVLEQSIDVMWFMTPGYEMVEVPYLYTVWDLQHRRQSFFPEVSVEQDQFNGREKMYESVIPRAAYVLAGNKTAQQEVVDFYRVPRERVKMLELPTPSFALEQKELLPLKNESIQTPYLFYPAQFWPHKNHMVILRALALLKEQGTLFHAVFTGADKGNLAYVQEQAEQLGIAEQVKFLGFVKRDELIALYQHAFALVFPSFFGPNNIPPLEAGALGCPIISADAAGMHEQLGEAALFFSPCSEQELVEQIQKLQRDELLRKQLRAAGKQRAFAWTANDYLQEVLTIVNQFGSIRRCWGKQQTYVR